MSKFIHLHNHSHYSLLDAICTIEGLVNAAKEHNMPAIALTDHGVMYGSMEFYNKAKKAGVKPIIGCEVYIVTKGSRLQKGKADEESDTLLGRDKSGKTIGKLSGRKSNYDHMVLLAKDLEGYQNLVKLCSIGHTEGFYYKPRIDSEILRNYSKGLVCLSACAGGVVSSHIARGDIAQAKEAAEIYKDIFGTEDFYLEMQNHGMSIEAKIREHVPALAKELGLKTIATNDIHYIKYEHHIPHNLYLYISTDLSKDKEGKNLETDLRYETDQVYFKSAEEMCKIFKDFPEAIQSTLEVADKCNLELPRGVYHMPDFPIPKESGAKTLDDYFRLLSHEGLREKIKNVTDADIERLDLELDVITKMKFSGYFLIVADFVNHAKRSGIYVGPGRGSAAGSLVCYALGITNVNPLDYNLLFERFLNPERVSMPDIDIDFQDDKRDEVIEYSRQKYGANSVSQIVTFNKLKTKAVLKDVGRVLNYPFDTINEITKLVPSVFGKIKSLTDCYNEIPEFKQYFDQAKEKKKLLDYAIVLENLNKNVSMHASGVVIAPSDISDYVPIAKAPQSDNQYMTQYDMKMLEDAGLIKMDFLGLKELKILQQAVDLIEQRHKIKIDLDSLPLNDAKTYEIFANGYTIGIFQFSKPKMREYLAKLKPKDINDLAAMNALYRPGPMDLIPEFIERKHGKKEVTYLHPDMEQVLKETYGVIVYQEQVMQLVRVIAGYSLAKADLVRRAMGKKDEKLMKEQEEEFIKGAAEKGYNKKVAKEIFKLILKFADYGFNKSHSVAYSVLAYYTAYLKTHYPLEFMTAQLNCRHEDMDEMVLLINECKRMKITLSLPDINECFAAFTINPAIENQILFGLAAIKNVGRTAVDNIVKERDKAGKFENFVDFVSRVDSRVVNKKTLEALIYAGAFDCFDKNRKKFYDNYEAAVHRYAAKKTESKGQSNLFDTGKKQQIKDVIFSRLPEDYRDWSDREKLSLEKSVLGLYVSAHPLSDYEDEINLLNPFRFSDVADVDSDEIDFAKLQRVRMCGIITDMKVKMSKKGNRFAVFTLEDFSGQGECVVFPKTYEQFKEILLDDSIVTLIGKAEENGNSVKLIVDEIKPLVKSAGITKMPETITIRIDSNSFDAAKLFEIKTIFRGNEGESAVIIHLKNGHKESLMELENVKIHYDKYTEKLLTEIFGKDNIILQ
ncbi:MAG TPA: DNA polymerase III subunit alpha [Ignavibacteria bacterium]|nr:DNA polymerase III subunit alpha [Ignavibacteria bacterium]HMQ98273.1 DNA polymerase III subunit alpha [Ignavibacteria bacterium]